MNETIAIGAAEQGGYESVLALFQAGGPVVAILAGLSIPALAITFLKLWQFAAVKITSPRFVDEALAHWRATRARCAAATRCHRTGSFDRRGRA